MGVSFPLFFFLCDFLGAFFLGQAWVEGRGMLALCRHVRYAAWKRTVHTYFSS